MPERLSPSIYFAPEGRGPASLPQAGDSTSGPAGPENRKLLDSHPISPTLGNRDALFTLLDEKRSDMDVLSLFEAQLEQTGLLPKLEQAGILPVVECPNPFDSDLETQQYEQWWLEHPKEGERFDQWSEKRTEILGYLYVGATLGDLLNELVPRPRPPSSESAPEQKGFVYAPPVDTTSGSGPTESDNPQPKDPGSEIGHPQPTPETEEDFSPSSPELDKQIPPDIRSLIMGQFGPWLGPMFLRAALSGLTEEERGQMFAEWRNPDPERVRRYRNKLLEITESIAAEREANEKKE